MPMCTELLLINGRDNLEKDLDVRYFVKITIIVMLIAATHAGAAVPKRVMENLDRGVVAMHRADGEVYVGWRLLGTDPEGVAFNLYRKEAGGKTELIAENRTKTTDFVDKGANLERDNSYFVCPVINKLEGDESTSFTLKANSPKQAYISIPLNREPGDETPKQFHTTVGDLDGDGEYEYIIRWSASHYTDPGRYTPSTDSYKLEAYELDGTRLWRIDLGPNVPAGGDFSQTVVYDIDGDGKAEIITKTSEGTVAGDGKKIGDANGDGVTVYGDLRRESPEFFSIFSGETGEEIARENWIPRGVLADWGDKGGNRANRHHMAVAYLDGVLPSLVIMRGDYARMDMEAWNFRDGKLNRRWTWSNKDNPKWYGKGSHMVRAADVTGDGRDEIFRGGLTLGPDGKVLYAKDPEGHGDEIRLGDLDPDRPGMEVWIGYEKVGYPKGVQLYDAATGECIWGFENHIDMGRSLAVPLDPDTKGYQLWTPDIGLYDVKGNKLTSKEPRCRHEVWWDADLCRELVDGNKIDKYNFATHTQSRLQTLDGATVKGGWADSLGDWREEIFGYVNEELRIYTTTISASNRLYTLMHDPAYRLGVSNVLQRKTPTSHPSFYLGPKMSPPPRPNIITQQ